MPDATPTTDPAPRVPAPSGAAADLSRASIEAVDRSGMLRDVLDQGRQLLDALWRVEAAGIQPREAPGGLLVCGMGGSGIGGDLAAAALGSRAAKPIRTVRDYAPGPGLGPETLVLCASYSGETEETLACYRAAGAAGATRVALTAGGKLAEEARRDGVPVIGIPGGFQPRAAIAYMVVAALECAALCGAAPFLADEIRSAAALLETLAGEWGPEAGEDSAAKALAGDLRGTVPVVFGAGGAVPVATRWKTQLNENAETPAFAAALPEADHNEICAWPRAPAVAPLYGVLLRGPDLEERISRRLELTAKALAPGATGVTVLDGRGETPLEQVLSLVLLGDLVSLYLAVLGGIDPTPVEAIERFKRELA